MTPQTRASSQRELSCRDLRRFEQMLDRGVLEWEDVDRKVTERRYELPDEDHPEKG